MVVLRCSLLLTATSVISNQNHIKSKVLLASLLYCTFRCCHLKKNSKQNSKTGIDGIFILPAILEQNYPTINFFSDMMINYSLLLYFISNLQMSLVLKIQEVRNLKTIFETKWGVFQILHEVNH